MRWTLRVACLRPAVWSSSDIKLSSGIKVAEDHNWPRVPRVAVACDPMQRNKTFPAAFVMTRIPRPPSIIFRKPDMKISICLTALVALIASLGSAAAQNPPQTSTRKVDGTDNVYIFRYGGHQSIFVLRRFPPG